MHLIHCYSRFTVTASLCRVALWAAERVVPQTLRGEWLREWRGGLWDFTLRAGTARALARHTRLAVLDALRARDWRRLTGSPAFSIAIGCALVMAAAIESGGLPASWRMLQGLPYRDPERIVLLTQGPPVLGMRLGFLDEEVALFRAKSKTLEAVATYTWRRTTFRNREIVAANVSRDFFRALGVMEVEPEGLWVSHEFFRKELGGRAQVLGQELEVGGKKKRLAGVLPRGFWFLSEPPAIWITASEPEPHAIPGNQWWLRLKGTVGRLRPGASPADADKELRGILVGAGIARRGFENHATQVRPLAYQSASIYGSGFLACVGALVVWAAFRAYRDRGAGKRFWAFFVLKAALPLLAIFLLMFEATSANTFLMASRVWWGWMLVSQWINFCLVAMVLAWAWRDQHARCRVCLHRLRQPLRIGVPGRILLDTAGQEVMCPQGHGSLYTSTSVLGAEISNRWLGLEV